MTNLITPDVIAALNYAEERYPNDPYPVNDDPRLMPIRELRHKTSEGYNRLLGKYRRKAGILDTELNNVPVRINFIRSACNDGLKLEDVVTFAHTTLAWCLKNHILDGSDINARKHRRQKNHKRS